MNDIKVTVICKTYNHELFIAQALESFVHQKTNFDYEVIVHDDASTDNTASIIRDFATRYPDIIKPIYQEENQYSKGIFGISEYILPRAKGKYIAFCEGDDYWFSEDKLQKQYDALENNRSCNFSVHKTLIVDVNGIPTGFEYPVDRNFPTGVVKSEQFLKNVIFTNKLNTLQFQLSSYFVKKDCLYEIYNNPPEFRGISQGSFTYLLFFGAAGDVYVVDEYLSCYRTGVKNGWVQSNMNSTSGICNTYKHHKEILESFDKYTGNRYHDRVEIGKGFCDYCIFKATENYPSIRKIPDFRLFLKLENQYIKKHMLMSMYFPKLQEFLRKIKRMIKSK